MNIRIKNFLKKLTNPLLIFLSIIAAILFIETIIPLSLSYWQNIYRNHISDNNKFYIYCVGGSTMVGWPFAPEITPGKIISLIFDHKINNKKIEIINIAKNGDNLFGQYIKLKNSLNLKPEKNSIILLYSGINEDLFIHYSNKNYFPLWEKAMHSNILRLALYLINSSLTDFFAETDVSFLSYLKSGDVNKYSYLLNKTKQLAKENNIPFIVSTIPSNLAGFNTTNIYNKEKFLIQNLKETLTEAHKTYADNPKAALNKINKIIERLTLATNNLNFINSDFPDKKTYQLYKKGLLAEKNNNHKEAIKLFDDIISLKSDDETEAKRYNEPVVNACLYRIGKCYETLKDYKQAFDYYKQSLPFYCKTPKPFKQINTTIREFIEQNNVALADTETIFINKAKNNIPSSDLFSDGHHPNLKGYILMCYEFAHQIKKLTGQKLIHNKLSSQELTKAYNFSKSRYIKVYITNIIWLTKESLNNENISKILSEIKKIRNLITLQEEQ